MHERASNPWPRSRSHTTRRSHPHGRCAPTCFQGSERVDPRALRRLAPDRCRFNRDISMIWLRKSCGGVAGCPRLAGSAPVAQLDRASVYGTEGREFESLRARLRFRPVGRNDHQPQTRAHRTCHHRRAVRAAGGRRLRAQQLGLAHASGLSTPPVPLTRWSAGAPRHDGLDNFGWAVSRSRSEDT